MRRTTDGGVIGVADVDMFHLIGKKRNGDGFDVKMVLWYVFANVQQSVVLYI